MIDKLIDQLHAVYHFAKTHKEEYRFADYVGFALDRYISTRRASNDFEQAFVALPPEKLEDLIRYCLRKGQNLSDDGIIANCKKYLKIKEER